MNKENTGKWVGVEFEGYSNKPERCCTVIECSVCKKHLPVTYGISEYKMCPFCGDVKSEFVEN